MTYKIKHLLNIFQHRKCMECTKIPFSRSMWAFFATKWQKKRCLLHIVTLSELEEFIHHGLFIFLGYHQVCHQIKRRIHDTLIVLHHDQISYVYDV